MGDTESNKNVSVDKGFVLRTLYDITKLVDTNSRKIEKMEKGFNSLEEPFDKDKTYKVFIPNSFSNTVFENVTILYYGPTFVKFSAVRRSGPNELKGTFVVPSQLAVFQED